jgi:drug/metabolite transporter (DMT)-like permease
VSWRRLAGAVACAVVGVAAADADALVISVLVLAVLSAVLASDYVAAARRRRRGEPSPLERLEATAG